MRTPVIVLCCAAVTFVLGGLMVGVWCAGMCLMIDSLAAAAWALLQETGEPKAKIPQVPGRVERPLEWVFERARRAS